MRVTSIQIEGRPGHEATVFRSETGEIVINTRHASRVCSAGDRDEQWRAARALDYYDESTQEKRALTRRLRLATAPDINEITF